MAGPWEKYQQQSAQPIQIGPGDPTLGGRLAGQGINNAQGMAALQRAPVQLEGDRISNEAAALDLQTKRANAPYAKSKAKADAIAAQHSANPFNNATEGQAKSAGFLGRALESEALYRPQNYQPKSWLGQMLQDLAPDAKAALPLILGGNNDKQDVVAAAQRGFIEAALRRDSGAAIPATEYMNARRTYFPSAGESPAAVAAKERLRKSVLRGLAIGSGPLANPTRREFLQTYKGKNAKVVDFNDLP